MAELVMVRYDVAPEHVRDNEGLVRDVFKELATTQPDGLGYATFALDDGRGFVHLAALEDGVQLTDVAAFHRFRAGLADRATAPPVRTPLRIVGSYRLLG